MNVREILFKAKRKDNSEWVEGYYRRIPCMGLHEHYIMPQNPKNRVEQYEINPNTLCQYTGLTDKNGKKIWENDVIRFNKCSNYPVVWNKSYCAFGSCYYSDFDHLGKYRNDEIDVVGNIFDDADLLEVE